MSVSVFTGGRYFGGIRLRWNALMAYFGLLTFFLAIARRVPYSRRRFATAATREGGVRKDVRKYECAKRGLQLFSRGVGEDWRRGLKQGAKEGKGGGQASKMVKGGIFFSQTEER